MRRICTSAGYALATETSYWYWISAGVSWVVLSGLCMTFMVQPEGSEPIRVAFYEIAAGLIPLLLGVYYRERRTEIRCRAARNKHAEDVLKNADEASLDDEAVARLRSSVAKNSLMLEAAMALSAAIPAAALTGEAIALTVVASGSSTMFSYTAVLIAIGLAACGAVSEAASSFRRVDG